MNRAGHMPYWGKRPQRKLREKLQKLRETALPHSRHLGTDAILFVEAAFAVSGTHRAGGFRMYAGVRDFGAAARSSAKDGIMAIRRRVVFELASAKRLPKSVRRVQSMSGVGIAGPNSML